MKLSQVPQNKYVCEYDKRSYVPTLQRGVGVIYLFFFCYFRSGLDGAKNFWKVTTESIQYQLAFAKCAARGEVDQKVVLKFIMIVTLDRSVCYWFYTNDTSQYRNRILRVDREAEETRRID